MTNEKKRSIIIMEHDELKNLVSEVKETVAGGAQNKDESNLQFSAADLWNIQKNRRNRTIRKGLIWN